MALYLIRHAKAGDRLSWTGDDRGRPLSKKGFRQAQRLAERFSAIPVARVLSSPYARCIETVRPVAAAKGLEVQTLEVLVEGASFFDVIALLETVADHTVLCSHGDVIPETIAALHRRGMEVEGPEDWRKGSTWVVERVGTEFARATTWAPPDDD